MDPVGKYVNKPSLMTLHTCKTLQNDYNTHKYSRRNEKTIAGDSLLATIGAQFSECGE